ncbi:MAG: hypothetical protein AB7G06_05055 [Bdellovibrionales bacterium]
MRRREIKKLSCQGIVIDALQSICVFIFSLERGLTLFSGGSMQDPDFSVDDTDFAEKARAAALDGELVLTGPGEAPVVIAARLEGEGFCIAMGRQNEDGGLDPLRVVSGQAKVFENLQGLSLPGTRAERRVRRPQLAVALET